MRCSDKNDRKEDFIQGRSNSKLESESFTKKGTKKISEDHQ